MLQNSKGQKIKRTTIPVLEELIPTWVFIYYFILYYNYVTLTFVS